MTDILIVYASTEGQTRKIARFAAEHFRRSGITAEAEDVGHLPSDLNLQAYGGVLVAASIHRAHHRPDIEAFVRQQAAALGNRHSGFISVSLSAAGGADDLAAARAMVDNFLAGAAWRPRFVYLAAGAFRYTKYGFFKRWILRRIAEAKGAPTDTAQDHELTDWEELVRFLDRFSGALQGGRQLAS